MRIDSTETFEMTWDVYYNQLSEEEYAQKLIEHIDQSLPGVPSEFRYTQIVSVGGSRSSKTYSILQLLMLEMINRERIKIVVWRDLKNVCRSTVMEDFQKIIRFDDGIYSEFVHNKQSGTFTYMPTGSRIIFEGADSIGKVLGGAQTISYFNEVTEFSHEVYLQIKQRTSERIICDYNPSKDFWLESARFDEDSIFIHSDFRNNAFCPPTIVKQLLSYEPWEPGSYEVRGKDIYYIGQIVSLQNQPPPHVKNTERNTANTYMWLVYGLGLGAEKPNKIYNGWIEIDNEYFEGLDYDSYYGMDFGAVNPTAAIEVKYDGNNAFFIREAMYQPLSEIDDSLATAVKLQIPQINKGNSLIVCDSAKQKFIDILINDGHYAVPATKGGGSVEVGITLVKSFKIFYVSSENLVKEYNVYSWLLDRYGKSTDIPKKADDHLMDALRYIISYMVEMLGIKL